MKPILSALAVIGLFLSLAANAQPASVTATCKDGFAFSGTSRSGACSGHGGVQTWDPPAPAVAPGGGAGLVWVNTASKVYHCPGDQWYGKTKTGEYMTEAKAKAAGDKPDHGKTCAK